MSIDLGTDLGNISDRFGRKKVLIISQIGATIGWAMLAFAGNIFWVFVARIVEGVSAATSVSPKPTSRISLTEGTRARSG